MYIKIKLYRFYTVSTGKKFSMYVCLKHGSGTKTCMHKKDDSSCDMEEAQWEWKKEWKVGKEWKKLEVMNWTKAEGEKFTLDLNF